MHFEIHTPPKDLRLISLCNHESLSVERLVTYHSSTQKLIIINTPHIFKHFQITTTSHWAPVLNFKYAPSNLQEPYQPIFSNLEIQTVKLSPSEISLGVLIGNLKPLTMHRLQKSLFHQHNGRTPAKSFKRHTHSLAHTGCYAMESEFV